MLSVKLMRWIDDRVGNALCSGLAATKRITTPFLRTPESYRRICVMKFFGIGSIVVASASLAALREAYPDAEIHFVTFKGNREVLEILGLIDKIWVIDNSSAAAFVESTLKVAAGLRRANIDLMIDFEFFAKFPLVLASLAQIPHKAGFHLTPENWRATLLNVPGTYNHYYHTKDIFLSLIYRIKTEDLYYLRFEEYRKRFHYPRFEPSSESLNAVRVKLAEQGIPAVQRLVLLNPNAGADLAPEVRKWPEVSYAELARRVVDEYPDVSVGLVGSPSERGFVEQIRILAQNCRVKNLAGSFTLRELLAAISLSELFVTNDSGPMHLACLVNARIVGLFFADTPTLFAPLAEHAISVSPELYSIPLFTVYNGKDMALGKEALEVKNEPARAVSVERVLAIVREQLAAAQSSAPGSNLDRKGSLLAHQQ